MLCSSSSAFKSKQVHIKNRSKIVVVKIVYGDITSVAPQGGSTLLFETNSAE